MTDQEISYRKVQEEARHNREMERLTGEAQVETARSNLAREAETYRSDLANEDIKRKQNEITGSHYERMDTETNRSNIVNEFIKNAQLEETKRNNLVTETQKGQQLAETQRNNLALERLRQQELSETIEHNRNTEAETKRSNLANEAIKYENLRLDTSVKNREIAVKEWAQSEVDRHNRATEQQAVNDWLNKVSDSSSQAQQADVAQAKTPSEIARNESQVYANTSRGKLDEAKRYETVFKIIKGAIELPGNLIDSLIPD